MASRWSTAEIRQQLSGDRVFRLLDKALAASTPAVEMENAARVSFLEHFDFQGREERIRQLKDQTLVLLYDDQMAHWNDLVRQASGTRRQQPN